MHPVARLCEVKADGEGWAAEVERMEADVAYQFKDLQRHITKYQLTGYDGRVLAIGYETASSEVLRKAKRLGWIE